MVESSTHFKAVKHFLVPSNVTIYIKCCTFTVTYYSVHVQITQFDRNVTPQQLNISNYALRVTRYISKYT